VTAEQRPIVDAAGLDWRLTKRVASRPGGWGVWRCAQCGVCVASCQVAGVGAACNPRRLIKLALLGASELVFSDPGLWLCARCQRCWELCPQEVRPSDVLLALAQEAAAAGRAPKLFDEVLRHLRASGRLLDIDDFTNRRRARLGLPLLPESAPSTARIFEGEEGKS